LAGRLPPARRANALAPHPAFIRSEHATDRRLVACDYISGRRRDTNPRRNRKDRKMDMRRYSGEAFIKVDDVREGPLQMQIAVVREGKFEKPDLVFESGEAFSVNSTTIGF
jgi:hypothetical protein